MLIISHLLFEPDLLCAYTLADGCSLESHPPMASVCPLDAVAVALITGRGAHFSQTLGDEVEVARGRKVHVTFRIV